ncbi:MAG: hypothetical protein AB1791_15940 [Chloroflexota bacterium]
MFELDTYLKLIWRWLWFLILGLAVGAVVAYFALIYLGLYPEYDASAIITVGAQLEAVNVTQDELSIGEDLVPNYVVLAEKPPITTKVIETLNLGISSDELTTFKLDVLQEGQTRVVTITGKDPNPEMAAAIANEIARELRATAPLRPTELIQIVSEAKPPEEASSTPLLIIVLAGLAGAAIFAVIAGLIELKRDRPQTLNWASSRFELPILGTFQSGSKVSFWRRLVGRVKLPSNWGEPAPVWWVVMETLKQALAIRAAEASQSAPAGEGQVVVVTSPERSQSKAIASLELARAWSTTGANVILVDADPAHSILHRWFKVGNEKGMTTLLSQNGRVDNQLDSMLVRSAIENLSLLTSGPEPTEPTILLNRRPWQQIVAQLTRKADVVIVNCPPVGTSPEAVIPALSATGVVMVVDLGKTSAGMVNQSSELLIKSGSTLLGAVVNQG